MIFSKAVLRAEAKKILNSQDASKRRDKSKKILEKLVSSGFYKKSSCVFAYVSMTHEVQTKPLIRRMLLDKKRVFIPKTFFKPKCLKFYEITSLRDLKKSSYGIEEPSGKKLRQAKASLADLVLVPGVLFDKKCRRLGHGAGFYDRFLTKVSKNAVKAALAYDVQLVDKLPFEKHDISMDIVLTNRK